MINYKTTAFLITALVALVPVASAKQASGFIAVNLARSHDAEHDVYARGSSFDPDTYEGGVYKVGYDACQTQLKSATGSVHITVSDDRKTLTAENVPAACMTIGGAFTNNYAEGYPVPMGSDKMKFTGVTEDTINKVKSALGAGALAGGSSASVGGSSASVGGSSASSSATSEGGAASVVLNSTVSRRLPSRAMKRKMARKARK